MRIGLFGGSFNPVHDGHIRVAEYALKHLELDEIIFIPCFKSVDKLNSSYADVHHRINLLLLSIPRNASISTFEISKHRPIESIETVRYFRNLFPKPVKLFFILGEDSFSTIETWESYKEIDELVNITIFRRHKELRPIDTKGLKRVIIMDNEPYEISSSNIRNRVSCDGLNKAAEIYIREQKLYNYVG